MSITVWINNNEKYIEENSPELIKKETYKCDCIEFSENKKPDSNCKQCKGTGIEYEIKSYPFEMNLSNVNFKTLWNSLGLDFDYCGEIDCRALMTAIRGTFVELIQRQRTEEQEKGKARVIGGGISKDQAQSYIDRLNKICEEAEKREEKIYWG